MRCSVILPAAGRGSRFVASGAAASSKIEFELEGRAVFLRSIDLFRGRPEVEQIILAVDPTRFDEFVFRWGEALAFLNVDVVRGGTKERWETVAEALKHVHEDATHVAVHDAARPATATVMIDRVFASAEACDAVIPGLPVADTLKRVDAEAGAGDGQAVDRVDDILGLKRGDADRALVADGGPLGQVCLGHVLETVLREGLVAVQTPQVFRAEPFRAAYEDHRALAGVTDDASLLERRGVAVTVVEGDPGNLKLTRAADAEILSALLRYRDAEAKQADAVNDLFGDDDDE
ncbi:MAG: 2-C-methyl-D-erythritol 4-phosphate cytidylyltransferase [Planctomycetota bacterium]